MNGKYKKRQFRKKFAKKSKKSTYRPRTKAPPKNKVSVNLGLGFPKQAKFTHRYHEIVSIPFIAGTRNVYSFSCNGMYDPNNTGTGHQPYYFDQVSALYNHYHVIGSTINVKIIPTVTGVPLTVGLFINDDPTVTPGDISTLCENSSSRWKVTSIEGDIVSFSSKWSAKKAFGGSIMGNSLLQGSVGSNPSEQQLWTIFGQPIDGTTETTVRAEVTITYIAIWDELKDIVGS